MLIDTHCHLQFKAYENDREEVILRCREKDLIMNVVGTQKDTSVEAVELAEKYPEIYATVGLHPIHLFSIDVDEEESSFVSREENFDEEYYGKLVESGKVIAVGETGLDLFHLPKNIPREKVLEKQKQIFIQQYNFAKKHGLPIVIHVRNAYEEMAELLRFLPFRKGEREGVDEVQSKSTTPNPSFPRRGIAGVIHCFSGNWEQAQKYLDLGLYLGFTGIISFPALKTNPKPNLELLEAVKQCPLDKMLVETDAPYLAPQKYRGKKCEPWMVEEVVKKIAEIKNKSEEEIKKITLENALRLFNKIK